jgi:hypothetical protein
VTADKQHDVSDAIVREASELEVDERSAIDGNQGFGKGLAGDVAQAGAEATCKHDDGEHGR